MKKTKLFCIIGYCAAFSLVGVITTNTVLNMASAVTSDGKEEWGHYPKVTPNFDDDGCKEFWISCETHEIVYEKPTGNVTIYNREPFNSTQIAQLSQSNDFRLLPRVNGGTDTYIYGEYPQSKVLDGNLVNVLKDLPTNSKGYVTYNGIEYGKVGTDRFFKVEPLKWTKLKEFNGYAYYLSQMCLDCKPFDSTTNNYSNSSLKSWLVNEFYKNAFPDKTYFELSMSLKTIEIPSRSFYETSLYGFTSTDGPSTTRECKVTEYSAARGQAISIDSATYGNGYYWTSTADSGDNTKAMDIGMDGSICSSVITSTSSGVRPYITINIE